jgi:hypothetical protein
MYQILPEWFLFPTFRIEQASPAPECTMDLQRRASITLASGLYTHQPYVAEQNFVRGILFSRARQSTIGSGTTFGAYSTLVRKVFARGSSGGAYVQLILCPATVTESSTSSGTTLALVLGIAAITSLLVLRVAEVLLRRASDRRSSSLGRAASLPLWRVDVPELCLCSAFLSGSDQSTPPMSNLGHARVGLSTSNRRSSARAGPAFRQLFGPVCAFYTLGRYDQHVRRRS